MRTWSLTLISSVGGILAESPRSRAGFGLNDRMLPGDGPFLKASDPIHLGDGLTYAGEVSSGDGRSRALGLDDHVPA
jgi:hypothetical protein